MTFLLRRRQRRFSLENNLLDVKCFLYASWFLPLDQHPPYYIDKWMGKTNWMLLIFYHFIHQKEGNSAVRLFCFPLFLNSSQGRALGGKTRVSHHSARVHMHAISSNSAHRPADRRASVSQVCCRPYCFCTRTTPAPSQESKIPFFHSTITLFH